MENKVCCLRKAIYSLKQAALQWNKALHQSLLEMGFVHTLSDPGIYVYFHGQDIIVMILFLGSALFLISSFRATSPFPGSLSYAYHHYLLIMGPLTFTVHAL